MGVKLNVGISKKVGLPNYGSAGSLCNLEIELDASALEQPEAFHRRVREAYAACRSAVEDELKNHAAHQVQETAAKQATPAPAQPEPVIDRRPAQPAPHGRGAPSPKQVEYVYQLARQVKLGSGQKLERLCEQMYSKPLTSLTGVETRACAPFWEHCEVWVICCDLCFVPYELLNRPVRELKFFGGVKMELCI